MVELQNFGWNPPTFVFLTIIFFALYGAWGLKNQAKEIWDHTSGKSVSVAWHASFMFMFASFLVYGVEQDKLGLIFTGFIRTVFYIPILAGLWKFKEFRRAEKFFMVSLVVLLTYMILSDHRATMFLVFSYLGVAATAFQPLEIWQEKNSGVVSIKLLFIYEVSGFFWIAYGFVFYDLPVLIMSISLVAIYTITILLWLKYRQPQNAVDVTV